MPHVSNYFQNPLLDPQLRGWYAHKNDKHFYQKKDNMLITKIELLYSCSEV